MLACFDAWFVLICLVLYYICLAAAEWHVNQLLIRAVVSERCCPGYCFSVHTLGFLMTFLFDLVIQLSMPFVMFCFVQFMITFSPLNELVGKASFLYC